MHIRPCDSDDRDALWEIIEPVLRAGETYALPRDWTRHEALAYWLEPPHQVFAAELDGRVTGTFFLTPNQKGGGAHVANCGFMTSQAFAGRGVASALCRYALDTAKAQGFYAMQFNFVVSSNTHAVTLWQKFGFDILTRLPGAFDHPRLGRIDALVMYRRLG